MGTDHEVVKVPAEEIVPGENDRSVFDEDSLRELADNIGEHGIMQPPLVRPVNGHFQIVAGERRYRAMSKYLKWKSIPVFIREMSDKEASEMMLAENMQRDDLDPIDECDALVKRVEEGWSVEELARVSGKTIGHVRSRMMLRKLIEQVRQLVRTGTIDVRYAQKMSRLKPENQQAAVRLLAKTPGIDLVTFREFCSVMKEKEMEAQPLFDLTELWAEEVNEGRYVPNGLKAIIDVPVDKNAPEVPAKPRGNHTGQVIHDYIMVLLEDDEYRHVAPVIGKLFEALVRKRLCRVPPPRLDE